MDEEREVREPAWKKAAGFIGICIGVVCLFLGVYFMVRGGKKTDLEETAPVDIYDCTQAYQRASTDVIYMTRAIAGCEGEKSMNFYITWNSAGYMVVICVDDQELGEYEYVVMDLSECMQGLFDVMRICVRIYTITLEDRAANGKLEQYENLMTQYSYEDVLEKTQKCNLPKIRRLPTELEYYDRGELAEYVARQLRELEGT